MSLILGFKYVFFVIISNVNDSDELNIMHMVATHNSMVSNKDISQSTITHAIKSENYVFIIET